MTTSSAVLLFLSNVLIVTSATQSENVTFATTSIIKKVFATKSSILYLTVSTFEQKESIFNNVVEQIRQESKLTLQLEDAQHMDILKDTTRSNVVMFVESFKSFQTIFKKMTRKKFNYEGFYLIVLTQGIIPEIQQIFQALWKIFIYNVDVLVDDGIAVLLLTFIPFKSNGICGDTEAVEINRFIFKKWETDVYFPKKFENLHRCPIKLGTYEYEPVVMRKKSRDGRYQYTGSDVDILNGVSGTLNFTINFNFMEPGSWGHIYENGTTTGAIKKVVDGEFDMVIGLYNMLQKRSILMSNSQPYFNNPSVLIVPQGASLPQSEKFLKPFQKAVWLFILLTIAFGLIVIIVAKFQSPIIQSFILGDIRECPVVNMINIILGGSMPYLPQNTFSRILLMIFILFCLVQRSLYQGSLYYFLQSNIYAKEVASIDEIVQHKYTVIMSKYMENQLEDKRLLKM